MKNKMKINNFNKTININNYMDKIYSIIKIIIFSIKIKIKVKIYTTQIILVIKFHTNNFYKMKIK